MIDLNAKANLLRTGRSDRIEDMFNREYIWFNRQSNWQKDDPNELLVTSKKIPEGIFTIPSFPGVKFFHSRLKEHIKDNNTLGVCFYWLNSPSDEPEEEYKRNYYKPGNKMLIITSHLKFLKIINDFFRANDYGFSQKPVNYYNSEEYDGERESLSPHDKDSKFHYENEYRILIRPNACYEDPNFPESKPIEVPVPGLQQISYMKNF